MRGNFLLHSILAIMSLSKRKFLSLEDRVKVVQMLEYGRPSRITATEFNVGRTQIQNVAKRKREILEEYESGDPCSKRIKRNVSYENIDALCYKWFLDTTSRQINVSGPLIKEKLLNLLQT